jgi:hypothetical protein
MHARVLSIAYSCIITITEPLCIPASSLHPPCIRACVCLSTFISASFLHHSCIIPASFLHHSCIIPAFMHMFVCLHLSLHHSCIIPASFLHHPCIILASLYPCRRTCAHTQMHTHTAVLGRMRMHARGYARDANIDLHEPACTCSCIVYVRVRTRTYVYVRVRMRMRECMHGRMQTLHEPARTCTF